MKPTIESDVLIIGGGLSGLSLAVALIEKNTSLTISIAEPRREYKNDRTWSFWQSHDHRWAKAVSHRWSRWCFGLESQPQQSIYSPHRPYQSIESLDFYRLATERIEASDCVCLYLGEAIERCEKSHSKWHATASQRQFIAPVVIDTRPPPIEQLNTSLLHQCFIGHVIEHPAAFKPDRLELMTDMASDEHGFKFTYCLPFGADLALVELTRFAPHPVDWAVLDADLHELKRQRGWLDAPIHRTERGQLPMGMAPRLASESGYAYAGTSAGGLRAATGYGFWRIQNWANACAEALDKHLDPLAHPPEPPLQAWMDRLFLRVLRHYPDRAPELFFRLYQRVPPEALIRFLSDQSSIRDKLKVVLSLPKRPFLAILTKR